MSDVSHGLNENRDNQIAGNRAESHSAYQSKNGYAKAPDATGISVLPGNRSGTWASPAPEIKQPRSGELVAIQSHPCIHAKPTFAESSSSVTKGWRSLFVRQSSLRGDTLRGDTKIVPIDLQGITDVTENGVISL